VDPLSDVLSISGVRGTLGARVEAGGNWATAFADVPDGAALHVVTAGTAWLTAPGRDPLELSTGDVVLVGAGIPHTLGDAPGTRGTRCDRTATARATLAGEVIALGSGPVTTRIVSLAYVCDRTVLTQVLTGLPDVVHVAATAGTCLDDTVRMLGNELATPQVATTAVLNSLVDIVLVQLFRAWTADRPAACAGTWLAMAGDPVVGPAGRRWPDGSRRSSARLPPPTSRRGGWTSPRPGCVRRSTRSRSSRPPSATSRCPRSPGRSPGPTAGPPGATARSSGRACNLRSGPARRCW
jgi:hypothetical protein